MRSPSFLLKICMHLKSRLTLNSNPLVDVTNRIDEVITTRITDLGEAKSVFLWAQRSCLEAARYFTLEDKCSDYVELIRYVHMREERAFCCWLGVPLKFCIRYTYSSEEILSDR